MLSNLPYWMRDSRSIQQPGWRVVASYYQVYLRQARALSGPRYESLPPLSEVKFLQE